MIDLGHLLPHSPHRWGRGLARFDWGAEWEDRLSATSGARVCPDCREVTRVWLEGGVLVDQHECDPDKLWEVAERIGQMKAEMAREHERGAYSRARVRAAYKTRMAAKT